MSKSTKGKLSLVGLILMIFTSVYGFNNIPRAFYRMGYASIPWYIIAGLLFFIPFAFMVTELGSAFKEEKGGIYSWMEKSVGPRYAFMGTFMWYASYVIWMFNISTGILVPLSNAIFGETRVLNTLYMSIFGVVWIIALTFISLHGLDWISKVASVGGVAVLAINALLLIGALIVVIHNGKPATPITFSAFFHSASPIYGASAVSVIAFMVYAIFAYGGAEAVGGLVDQTDKPEKNFPKGVISAALIITIGYSVMILMVGFAIKYVPGSTFYEGVKKGTEVNLGTSSYVVLNYLGQEVGAAFGMTHGAAVVLGEWFARILGISLVCSLLGAFFTLIYSPIKQIIMGTPKELWPARLGELDGRGMPRRAMKVQMVFVLFFIILNLILSIANKGAADLFFEFVTNMTNVSMTLPYLFIVFAFYRFKKNDKIKKPFVIFKSKSFATFIVVLSMIVIGFANFFTIIQPLVDYFTGANKDLGYSVRSFISMIVGPILFALIANGMMGRYLKKYPKGEVDRDKEFGIEN
ncbi:MAG: glutamate/gamma-aminobutyrate family transporter YjeM [Lachnospiraceae bacterium]|jgi:amino acid transporter|nr:glutamate/gamma-aminobutyrate family transporter YjeM [Lachnospiraceae bacterium]